MIVSSGLGRPGVGAIVARGLGRVFDTGSPYLRFDVPGPPLSIQAEPATMTFDLVCGELSILAPAPVWQAAAAGQDWSISATGQTWHIDATAESLRYDVPGSSWRFDIELEDSP